MEEVKDKVYVILPTGGNMRPELLPYFLALKDREKEKDYIFVVNITISGETSPNRNALIEDFLKTDFNWALFMDADTVPIGNIFSLLKHKKPVVSGVYFVWMKEKLVPLIFERFKKEGKNQYRNIIGKVDEKTMLVETDGVGGGALLVKREVIESIDPPWFLNIYDKRGQRFKGNDLYFCEKVKKAGYKIYADLNMYSQHWKEVDLLAMHKYMRDLLLKGSDINESSKNRS